MAAAAPVRPLNVDNDDRQGNRCPICQVWEAPSWRGTAVQVRLECCGVLICKECFVDWKGEREKVTQEFAKKCGVKAYAQFNKRWSKNLRARVRGKKDKEEAKSTTKKKGGKQDDEKKRALEKLLERHWTCPSCRAPLGTTDEDRMLLLRRKAEQGQSWAQCELGHRYLEGRTGVRKDARQAERWFRAARTDMSVMDGGPEASYQLAGMCILGNGVRKDVEEAKKLLTMAHEAGHLGATHNLAVLFRGVYGAAAGVPDLEKAVTLYHQAAEAGDDDSQYDLGCCYDGEGVEQNKEKAKAWYAKAAKQGHAEAMNNLAAKLLQTEGAAAMPAFMALLRAAAEKGHTNAQRSLLVLEKQILSSCASCGKPASDMAGAPLKCARCKAAAYCSAACQKQHWKRGGHKKECNARERYLPEKEEEE